MKFKRIYVEITNRCNLNCSFCAKSKRPLKEMTVEEFQTVLNEIKPFTNHIYLHVKGEPLLHPYLNQILSCCDEKNMKVSITTNGTLLATQGPKLKNHPCLTHLYISLHCEQKDPAYLTKIFQTVDSLPEKITIIYRFWTLKDGENNSKIVDIVEKMKEHYKLENEFVEEVKTHQNVKINAHCYIDKAKRFEWPDEKGENSTEGYCFGGKSHIAILSDGSVVPCCLDGEGVINLGNIFKTPLVKILSSERFLKLRKGFEQRKITETLCLKCTYKNRF